MIHPWTNSNGGLAKPTLKLKHGWIVTFHECTLISLSYHVLNSLRPRQNGRNFADDTFKCIFLNENISISIKITLKFVPNGPINNIPALVQITAWRRPGDKPLSELMMVILQADICVTRPQWVKLNAAFANLCSWKRVQEDVGDYIYSIIASCDFVCV